MPGEGTAGIVAMNALPVLFVLLLAWTSVIAQAPPPARAVDADYWQRRAERELADQRKARKYYLGLSQLLVAPDNATPYQDVIVKTGLVVQGLEPGMCPDPGGVTMAR